MKTKKGFDCVDIKRRAQERVRADLEGKAVDEEIAYFRRRAGKSFERRIEAEKTSGK